MNKLIKQYLNNPLEIMLMVTIIEITIMCLIALILSF